MRSQSVSGVWITTVISLIGVDVGFLGGSSALAQEAVCGTIESDPATYEDPSGIPPLPAYCFGPAGPGPNVCTDNGCIIDVLVVYTPAAKNAAGGVNAINDRIGEAVDTMNVAFVNSQIQSFVRLVGTAEVDYDESYDTLGTEALGCLTSSSCMPLAHVLRDKLKADIVSLFVTQLGAGISGNTYSYNHRFNVVYWAWAARNGAYVFAHETGHNLYAQHEISINCVPPPTGPSYCHAYVRQASPSFTTIMNSSGGSILHYSNPAVSYPGVPDVPTGTATCNNNARCIRDYAPMAAGGLLARISDCNLNGICDAVDIANCPPGDPTCQDCEHNGVPDGCFYSGLNGTPGDCCLDGTCILKTELCCLYEGGTFMQDPLSACDEDCNINGVNDACESPGACCRPAPYNDCLVLPEDCCIAFDGTFRGAGTRCGSDCNLNGLPDGCESGPSDPLGACCSGGMGCEVKLASCCTGVGLFGGAGTYCEDCNGNGWPAPCEAPASQEYGACCNGDGACIIATQCSCQGQFQGVGTTCGSPLVGACCTGSACSVSTEAGCGCQGGVFITEGVTCDDCNGNGLPDACEVGLNACCLPGGQCVLWTAECCSAVGGEFYPRENQCTNVYCAIMAPAPGP